MSYQDCINYIKYKLEEANASQMFTEHDQQIVELQGFIKGVNSLFDKKIELVLDEQNWEYKVINV